MYREHKNTVDIAPRQKETKFTCCLPGFTRAWQGKNRMVDDVGAMNSSDGVAFSSGVDKVQSSIGYSLDVDFRPIRPTVTISVRVRSEATCK